MYNIQTEILKLKKLVTPAQVTLVDIFYGGSLSSKQKYLKYKNKCLRLKN
jgi:hypothetical protein